MNTPSLTNIGTITAKTGNVNIQSPQGLYVGNTDGTISAKSANVNISSGNNGNIYFLGGSVLSKEVNINAGNGAVTFDPQVVTGVVNINGKSAVINTNTPNLLLGNINTSGDPNFSNTGNLTIDGTIAATGGNPWRLSLVAT